MPIKWPWPKYPVSLIAVDRNYTPDYLYSVYCRQVWAPRLQKVMRLIREGNYARLQEIMRLVEGENHG